MLKTFSARALLCAAMLPAGLLPVVAQSSTARFDMSTKEFRLDGGNVTYVFGVSARGELQQMYWGGRLAGTDSLPPAVPMREWASFDSPYSNTPQEYAGWGAGLFMEPALKVAFADGNRDLVLHYESESEKPNGFDVFFFLMIRQPPRSPLFPYTTLFRL